jgi:hypothetical protein
VTHEDAGHYAAKHSKDIKANPKATEAVKLKAINKKITCSAAHKIATDLKVPPKEVGTAIDLLEYRITKCQMGLYGYGPRKKIVKPAETVSPDLEKAIHGAKENNRLSCFTCWQIAERLHLSKMDVSAACETLGIKLHTCQLGSF